MTFKTIKELKRFNKGVKTTYWLAYERALEEVLEVIEETWSKRKQTTDKIMFMMDFKKELKARIDGKWKQ